MRGRKAAAVAALVLSFGLGGCADAQDTEVDVDVSETVSPGDPGGEGEDDGGGY